jgi:hypothetical protein
MIGNLLIIEEANSIDNYVELWDALTYLIFMQSIPWETDVQIFSGEEQNW